jgi:hypothetical protein
VAVPESLSRPLPGPRLAAIFIASTLIVSGVFLFVDAYPQPALYFDFADKRRLFGISNFWNVVSNAAFLLPGVGGLWLLRKRQMTGILVGTRLIYIILFCGVTLTAFGSAWFHLQPDNASLVWDRLPMTVVFMALTAAIVAEYISLPAGRTLLIPLLSIGIASVFYWATTEARGAGDLRPYGLVQFLPMLLIPAIALSLPSPFGRSRHLLQMFVLYALAKVAEFFDAGLYSFGQLISGHTLKHLIAACAIMALLRGLANRRPHCHEH